MSGFELDGWDEFVADLRGLKQWARVDARAVPEHGAFRIANQLRSEMRASRHFGQVAAAISYDILDRVNAIEVEIGPVKGSPGSLANIAYFGTSRGGGTVPDPREAFDAEVPNIEKHLAELLVKRLAG